MRITITITDESDDPNSKCRIDVSPPVSDLINLQQNRPAARSSAAMYAFGMLTWAARRSKELNRPDQGNFIILPPGVRES